MSAELNARKAFELIQAPDVKKALSRDLSNKTELKTWETTKVTTPGVQFTTMVLRVVANYHYGVKDHATYIVKVNPCFQNNYFKKVASHAMAKEIEFYEKIRGLLDTELQKIQMKEVKIPKCYFTSKVEGKEVIYLEDLTENGFVTSDRKLCLDRKHCVVAIKELARLHAASHLLFKNDTFKDMDILEKYPGLSESYEKIFSEGMVKLRDMMNSTIKFAAKTLFADPNYGHAAKYLSKLKAEAVFTRMLKYTEQFKAICHGEPWTNNFMFRYRDDEVVHCSLIDFQLCRVGSLALDLNTLIYSSAVLHDDLDVPELLKTYHQSFSYVTNAATLPMPFTVEQLEEEFKSKNAFGLLTGLLNITTALRPDGEEEIDMNMSDASLKTQSEKYTQHLINTYETNEVMKKAFLGMINKLNDSGFFKTDRN